MSLTIRGLIESARWAAKHFGATAELEKNRVGNLSIIKDGNFVGYIDLNNGEVGILE